MARNLLASAGYAVIEKIMKKKNCKIIESIEICPGYFYLVMEWENATSEFKPGQFIEIKINDELDPLIRRPFSIFDADNASIKIAYKRLGKGTTLLSKKKPGDYLDIIGPLGNGYPTDHIDDTTNILLLGGGTGVASIFYLNKILTQNFYKTTLSLGFKSQKDIFCMNELKSLTSDINISTEDGSYGEQGFITDLFSSSALEDSAIFACGPKDMIKTLSRKSGENNNIYTSLEEYMACGLGLCNGCVVKVKGKNPEGFLYKTVCKEGPVFNLRDIIWT